jgi:hypothetical protein
MAEEGLQLRRHFRERPLSIFETKVLDEQMCRPRRGTDPPQFELGLSSSGPIERRGTVPTWAVVVQADQDPGRPPPRWTRFFTWGISESDAVL